MRRAPQHIRWVVPGKRADGSCDPDKLGKTSDWLTVKHKAGVKAAMQLLRRSWETRLLLQGTSAAVVAAWAGHSTQTQDAHYFDRSHALRERRFMDAVG